MLLHKHIMALMHIIKLNHDAYRIKKSKGTNVARGFHNPALKCYF